MSGDGLDELIDDDAATVGSVVRRLRAAFEGSGEAALAEARMLTGHVLGLDLTGLVMGAERPVAREARAAIVTAARRRIAAEPMQRVIGRAGFFGRDFALSSATLVPRDDTETLIETVLGALSGVAAPVIADLGVGSGVILVTLLAEMEGAIGIGTDLSAEALATTAANAATHGVDARAILVRGSYASMLAPGRFDAIVSNPPYIETAAIDALDREVRLHDPRLALDGGDDGLDAYRAIEGRAAVALVEGGLLAVEIGWRQGPAVAALLAAAGWSAITVVADLAGRDRVVTARRRTAGASGVAPMP